MKWVEGSLVLRIYNLKGTIALGKGIFINTFASKEELAEGINMSRKSLYFGPLYLPVVFIPHIIIRYWRNRFK